MLPSQLLCCRPVDETCLGHGNCFPTTPLYGSKKFCPILWLLLPGVRRWATECQLTGATEGESICGLSSITVILYKIVFSDCVFPPKSNSSMIEAPWLLSLAVMGEKEHCDSCAGPLETYSPFPKPPRGEKSKPVSPSSWGSTKGACLSACSNKMCYVGI